MDLQEALMRIEQARQQQLKTLDLTNCSLTEIPSAVFALSQLTELKLGHWSDYSKQHKNAIRQLPATIAQLTHLQSLELSSNEISHLPEELCMLSHLQLLDLSNNRLQQLPETIGQLQQLHTLDVNNNQLTQLPDSLAELEQLQRLNFSKNRLHSFLQRNPKWQKLQRLDISNNQLTEFPTVLAGLANLEQLSLSNNRLSALPEAINQFPTIKILYLNNNQIKQLPQEWYGLRALRRFYLNNNQVEYLPKGFAQLADLHLLDLGNNNLDELPPVLLELKNLAYLDVRKNHISHLPEALAQLQQLQMLDVRDNMIAQVPSAIVRLPNLQHLYISENPLESPPPEIANRGLTAMQTYFTALEKSNEQDYIHEIKLLLVGEGRVGKTSLTKSITIPDYVLEDHQSTEGIDIRPWYIDKNELGTSRDFRVNIWDFGGQEIYHTTHQFFLTKRSIYLLVTESRKEDKHEDFYYWLNIIRLLGGRSPVIIVLNKCDQPTKDLPIKEYRKTFTNIVDFSKISCQPDYKGTINSLQRKIRQILQSPELLPHLSTPLPKVWVDIRQKLEDLRNEGIDYISYQDYLKICKRYYQNETNALFLSEFFHDLGVMLHFQDDPILRETIFLNHDWVTQGVYKVLDNQVVKNKQGNFTEADLETIWSDYRYANRRKELFALMRNDKFELCFEVSPGHYLAPQLLPVDEIEHDWQPRGQYLRFEYRYQFMPKGTLTRFIVKQHANIYRNTYWRYGVLLSKNNTRALIKENYFDRKISIAIEGDNSQELLHQARQTINELNSSFNNVMVDEMVACNCLACANSKTPHYFKLEVLLKYAQNAKPQIDCEKSLASVEVLRLLHTVLPSEDIRELVWESEDQAATARYENLNLPKEEDKAEISQPAPPEAAVGTIEELEPIATPQKADAIRQTLAESYNQGSSKLSNIVKNTTDNITTPPSEEKPKWLMWVSVAFLLAVFAVAAYFLMQSL